MIAVIIMFAVACFCLWFGYRIGWIDGNLKGYLEASDLGDARLEEYHQHIMKRLRE